MNRCFCVGKQSARAIKQRQQHAELSSNSSCVLQSYWDAQGCALLQPMTWKWVAGTSHTATFPRPGTVESRLYVQPPPPQKMVVTVKPQPFAALLPVSSGVEAGTSQHSGVVSGLVGGAWFRSEKERHSLRGGRLGEPTLGATGLGWEVWLNGMEVTQFTYFQQVGGVDCKPCRSPARSPTVWAWPCICRAWKRLRSGLFEGSGSTS